MRDHAHSMTENELKGHVLNIAREKGWMAYHAIQAKVRNAGDHGYPDLTLARDGEVVWIELKRQDGKLTYEQVVWSMALPSNNGAMHYEVIRPSDLARGRVDEILA